MLVNVSGALVESLCASAERSDELHPVLSIIRVHKRVREKEGSNLVRNRLMESLAKQIIRKINVIVSVTIVNQKPAEGIKSLHIHAKEFEGENTTENLVFLDGVVGFKTTTERFNKRFQIDIGIRNIAWMMLTLELREFVMKKSVAGRMQL